MIYLIDDDKSVRRAFEIFLRSADLDYKSLESAEEFLLIFKPNGKDLLVLDLNMPGITGCDLLKKFMEEGIHLPVIAVTGFDEQKYRECCKAYGVIAYLRKPVDGEALIDLIKYNLDIHIPTNNNISSQSKRSNV